MSSVHESVIPERPPSRTMSAADLHDRLGELLRQLATEHGIPGIALAADRDGESVTAVAGVASVVTKVPLSAASRFEISCITKFLMALVCQRLVADGVLRLEDSVVAHLPELRRKPAVIDDAVTLAHLLSHTSGISGPDILDSRVLWGTTWDTFLKYLDTIDDPFQPGTMFSYEHAGYVILGRALQKLTGRPALQLMEEMILAPLQIVHGTAKDDRRQPELSVSGHRGGEAGKLETIAAMPPSGFWQSSLSGWTVAPADLLAVARLLSGGEDSAELARLLGAGSLSRLLKPLIVLPEMVATGERAELAPIHFGPGCAKYRNGLFGHNGSINGHTCALRFDPGRRLSLCVAMNIWRPDVRDLICDRVLEEIGSRHRIDGHTAGVPDSAPPLRRISGGLAPEALQGTYVGDNGKRVSVGLDEEWLSISGGAVKRPFVIRVPRSAERDLSVQGTHDRSIGFFTDPRGGSVSLMIDLNVLRKVSS
jgi:CubicO group peptidase (beta-lactamase class C family)